MGLDTCGVEIRFIVGPEHILFAGVCVCIVQNGSLSGWGSEEVNIASERERERERERELSLIHISETTRPP